MSAKVNLKARALEQVEQGLRLGEHLKGQVNTLVSMAKAITHAIREGHKVLIFGNGGSAAEAQHIACELAGKFQRDRDPLPALALTTNTSTLTAIANDYGYEAVFARQLKGLVARGDVVIGISTSGLSASVLLAMEEASRLGAITIAFTGQEGRLKEMADYVLSVPSGDTPRIQEQHTTAGHILCYLVEESLFGEVDAT